MGSWGAAIFADDYAADIRGDWREAIEDGLDAEAATTRLIERYHVDGGPHDEDERTFWIALAAAQAATGRLQIEVKKRALEVIAAGGDVALFAEGDPALGRRRERVLADLAETLKGPQRAPTVIKRPLAHVSPAVIGDLVVVRGSGSRHRELAFVVVGVTSGWPRGSTAPELIGLSWDPSDIATRSSVDASSFLRSCPHPQNVLQDGERIDVWNVQGPTRGPKAFKHHARVAASGLSLPDIDLGTRDLRTRDYRYHLTLWHNLAAAVDSDWFVEKYALDRS